MNIVAIRKELRAYANPEKVAVYKRFFKTGKGQYGEGDLFLGVSVPHTRIVAKKYVEASFPIITQLFSSPYHEERLLAVLLLVQKTHNADELAFKEIYEYYLEHRKGINNWDLVDLSAHKIVGRYLHTYHKSADCLYTFAHAENLWERRIAILSTFWYINTGSFAHTLALAEILVHDPHDLMHKAVGWMLREVGKRDMKIEEEFLKTHYTTMPRTMLRYAIEKFPEKKRQEYLKVSCV